MPALLEYFRDLVKDRAWDFFFVSFLDPRRPESARVVLPAVKHHSEPACRVTV